MSNIRPHSNNSPLPTLYTKFANVAQKTGNYCVVCLIMTRHYLTLLLNPSNSSEKEIVSMTETLAVLVEYTAKGKDKDKVAERIIPKRSNSQHLS